MKKDVYVTVKVGDDVLTIRGDVVVEPDSVKNMKDAALKGGRVSIDIKPV